MIINNQDDFNNLIKDGYVLVDFFAKWCGSCKQLSPIFDEVEKDYLNIKFVKIDIDEFEELSLNYQVMSLPTLLLLKDGNVVARKTGTLKKEELKDWLNNNIN